MKTIIDSNSRVFQIIDSFDRSYFCNLQDIQLVCNELKDSFKIYHFWNSKPAKVSKSYLKELFLNNDINVNKSFYSNML